MLTTIAGNTKAEETIQRLIEHVDRIAAWGPHVNAPGPTATSTPIIICVVRLELERALSLRLRDQNSGWTERPFFVRVAHHAPSGSCVRWNHASSVPL
ncbi:hypothetical protein [Archangium sp. Cb G35]|uniref:hypothetical protein n=1 Tax=Archangium sp. Cb G35 TaxID=1920190 RepID=UPI0011610B73|nr:hypothetical protein [Archangium sp. Cb G35]